jgi:hypothetical protein
LNGHKQSGLKCLVALDRTDIVDMQDRPIQCVLGICFVTSRLSAKYDRLDFVYAAEPQRIPRTASLELIGGRAPLTDSCISATWQEAVEEKQQRRCEEMARMVHVCGERQATKGPARQTNSARCGGASRLAKSTTPLLLPHAINHHTYLMIPDSWLSCCLSVHNTIAASICWAGLTISRAKHRMCLLLGAALRRYSASSSVLCRRHASTRLSKFNRRVSLVPYRGKHGSTSAQYQGHRTAATQV